MSIGPCTELKRVRPCAPGRPHVQEVRHDVQEPGLEEGA